MEHVPGVKGGQKLNFARTLPISPGEEMCGGGIVNGVALGVP